MKKTFLLVALSLTIGSSANAAPTSAKSLQQTYAGFHRVLSIAQNIFKANLKYCKSERGDFGFSYVHLNRNTALADRTLWAEAFDAKEIPSVMFVFPNGAAERAGLRIGDLLVSVNGKPWPAEAVEQEAFVKALSDAMHSSSNLQLVARRKDENIPILVTADKSCGVNINFVQNNETMAFAGSDYISVESGLEKLLESDAELSFIIAHEIAHVILGHFPLPTKDDAKEANNRALIERAADELGIKLMLRAGYDPDAATTVIKKIDHANRGPISRLLGLFGDYMPTEQRVEFLKDVAANARNAD